MSQTARLRKAAVGAFLGFGLGRLIGARVDAIPTVDAPTASAVLDELRRLFGGRRLEIAVIVGERLRPNRKPVLHVMTERGDVLGYVKIGWNALTRRLVSNEAEALTSMTSPPPETFRVPTLLHEADVGTARITVLSPLRHRLFRRGPLGAPAPYEAIREIAFRGEVETCSLAGSGYERAIRARIADVGDDDRRELLARLLDRVFGEAADAVLTFGSWHGDWAPWNMARTRTGLFVWDWERHGSPAPVGLDALHHRFCLRAGDPGSLTAWMPEILSACRETLLRLGVEEINHGLLLRLYLLEMIMRFEEGLDAGLPVPAGWAELERTLWLQMAWARR